MPFSLKTHFSHSYANQPKTSPRRGTGEKYGFWLLAGRQQRVQLKLRDANDKFD